MGDVRARMECVESDITKLDVEAIVNAANDRLVPGGGVDGAIHRAAGPELAEACRRIGRCPAGEVRVTPGFRLKARHVIHAVGPVWRGGANGEDSLLAAAYRNSLEAARACGATSVAFPAISTGRYRYPPDRAARMATRSVADYLRQYDRPARVVFACFGAEMTAIYRSALADVS
jgi:O-acetyl-ADP-ribose deacetylase